MMGKKSRWFKALLGSKKSSDSSPASEYSPPTKNEKKKWGFVRSFNGNDRNVVGTTRVSYAEASSSGPYEVEAIDDANKHAIAVAAATAAVAEAALAAAQAAAEVVRLTSRPLATWHVSGSERRRELAAVKIQSAFRAYLARRALRALKGLVRLQALVRGRIVRKQSAEMLRRMQSMARIQARACANRAQMSEAPSHSCSKSSQSRNPRLAIPKKFDNQLRANSTKSDRSPIVKRSQSKSKIKDTVELERTPLGSNWLDCWMEECSWNSQRDTSLKTGHADDERSDKILKVDTWKPHLNSKQSDRIFRTPQHLTTWNYNDQGVTTFNPLSKHTKKSHKKNPSISSGEVSSLTSLKLTQVDQAAAWKSENSPHVHSASSRPGSSGRGGPFTPRSECSRSVFSEYLGYPNYMANTESYLAKVRSQSAPKQRMQVERVGSTKRFGHGIWEAETIPESGLPLHAAKAYSGSGHLDRLGMPVQGNTTASYGGRC